MTITDDLAPDDPILHGEGSGECSPLEDMFFLCDEYKEATPGGYKRPIGPQPLPRPGIAAWLRANSSAVYLGAGALALMAVLGGRRR